MIMSPPSPPGPALGGSMFVEIGSMVTAFSEVKQATSLSRVSLPPSRSVPSAISACGGSCRASTQPW